MNNKKVRFIRKGGRVIPIRTNDDPERVRGSSKIISGLAIGAIGAKTGTSSLKKSFGLYSKFAGIRGASKLVTSGSKVHGQLIKKAALVKRMAIKSTNMARFKFGAALGLASMLISSGTSDMFSKSSSIRDEISGVAGTLAGAGIVAITAKRFGVKATAINELFTGFAKQGQALTKNKIWKIARTKATFSKPKYWGKSTSGEQLKFF